MADVRETVWEYVDGETTGTFYTAERRRINQIHKLKEKYPDQVDIRHINPDGSLVAHLPEAWFKLSPPKKVNMSDEQKDEKRRLLAEARAKKLQNLKNDT